MLKSIRKKQLGVQLLEYGLLGAIVVGGGAYATTELGNKSVAKTGKVTTCMDSVGAVNTTGIGSAADCNTKTNAAGT
jgi:hypothetical protein